MIVLKNNTRTQQVFTLSPCPGTHCGTCYCTTREVTSREQLPDGSYGLRVTRRTLPGSITLLAGASDTFPDWVGSCKDVRKAIDRGSLSLVQIAEPQAPAVLTSSKGKRSVL